MGEALLYLVSSFWLGAVHAATPGHGKTIAAAYIVGARGKPTDAWILGIFVTLSHTSGIVVIGVLASLGLPGFMPQRLEAYLALFTGLLVIAIGAWTLWTQRALAREFLAALAGKTASTADAHSHAHPDRTHADHTTAVDHAHGAPKYQRVEPSAKLVGAHSHAAAHGAHGHDHGHEHAAHDHSDAHTHSHAAEHSHDSEAGYHTHGWGMKHTHNLDLVTSNRPSLWMLIGLGIAGGLLPDPAALGILLNAVSQGKMMLGLGTVLVFSLGFASTLVLVGVVASKVGRKILDWLAGPWAAGLQIATSVLIVLVGVFLTVQAATMLERLG